MSEFPDLRLRRLRLKKAFRNLVQETRLHPNDFIYPLFVVPGSKKREAISSMPGQYRYSSDEISREVERAARAGIQAVLLFGIPSSKDSAGKSGSQVTGVVQKAIRAIKKNVPDVAVITDVCLCEYTDHGHCGIIKKSKRNGVTIDNDATLPHLSKMALSHVDAGADMVAPSDMMDGRIAAIRATLDSKGYSDIPIMSYAAKYSSGFYGPFRDAAESAPKFGDRESYQMDPSNFREAMREIELDITEGADILMVKPALSYLDVLSAARAEFDEPLAAYNVSGEYSMVKAAAAKGWIDEKRVALEILASIKRAGADMILTYWAVDAARWVK